MFDGPASSMRGSLALARLIAGACRVRGLFSEYNLIPLTNSMSPLQVRTTIYRSLVREIVLCDFLPGHGYHTSALDYAIIRDEIDFPHLQHLCPNLHDLELKLNHASPIGPGGRATYDQRQRHLGDFEKGSRRKFRYHGAGRLVRTWSWTSQAVKGRELDFGS